MANVQNFFDSIAVYKDMYLKPWGNLLNTEASPLSSKIKNYPITGGGKIEAVAQVGFNGGFASLGDDLTAPKAGRNIYQKFTADRKRMAVTMNISDEAIQASANNNLAMLNLFDQELRSCYETAKWNVGRMLFGNGDGILTLVKSVSGNTLTLPNDGTEKPQNVMEGMTIDVYKQSDKPGTAPTASARRVVKVNRETDPVTFEVDGDPISLSDEAFVTIQMSYGNEITGLGAIFDDNITELYGVKKADVPLINPVVTDAEGDISDSVINRTLRTAQDVKGSDIDMILMGNDAFDQYVEYLRVNNLRNERADLVITGGFRAIQYMFGNHSINIVNERFVPKNEAWGFDTRKLGFYQLGEWDFIAKGGSAFTLMPGTLVYNGVLAKYGNLICTNPGGCIRIKNAAA